MRSKVRGSLTWSFLCLLGASCDFFIERVGCCRECCFFIGGRWPGEIFFVCHSTDCLLPFLIRGAQVKSRCQAESQIIIRPCGTNMVIYISMLILYKAQSQSAFENSCTASLVDRQLCMACFFLRSKVVVNVNPGNCRATHASFGTFQSTS